MLENNRSFFRRHIGNSAQEQKKMLNELGYKDIKELISKTVSYFGLKSVRGSTNKKGAEALRKMVKFLKNG